MIRSSILGVFLLGTACGQPASYAANAMAPVTADAALDEAPAPTAGVAPIEPATTAEHAKGQDGSNAGIHDVLRDVLVAVGQVDGTRIMAVRQPSRCLTEFETANGKVVVDWTKVRDFQSRIEMGRVILPIETGSERPVFSTPQNKQPEPVGDAANRMEMGFGSLLDACSR